MINKKYIYTLQVCVFLFSIISADEQSSICDKSRCKGPVKYYESLGCTPIYSDADNCCPIRFNCDHLKGRARNKCYYRGRAYEIGEALEAENTLPCDINCVCSEGWKDIASFSCAEVDCFGLADPGCYLKSAHNQCCDWPQICPANETNLATCELDGKTYYDGQPFTPTSEPDLYCICGPGYTGQNVEPFCKNRNSESYPCDADLRGAYDIHNNCTPAFYINQNPATECNLMSRCQNKNDEVLKRTATTKTELETIDNPDWTCIFGNLTMNLGDELNQGTHYDSVCIRCVCEVPPYPTCQRLPDNECDVTVHAKFD
ncbi:uncharacterized protein LOC105686865 [Athalia rosae]|uniref:uncharacterized protein LOC105686865 n=1 Tax=Athalia rosae TaxID=37344 RepID=UPI002033877A|nr:uncharacterized protein LOC105686865 [Athalia rosae]